MLPLLQELKREMEAVAMVVVSATPQLLCRSKAAPLHLACRPCQGFSTAQIADIEAALLLQELKREMEAVALTVVSAGPKLCDGGGLPVLAAQDRLLTSAALYTDSICVEAGTADTMLLLQELKREMEAVAMAVVSASPKLYAHIVQQDLLMSLDQPSSLVSKQLVRPASILCPCRVQGLGLLAFACQRAGTGFGSACFMCCQHLR